MQSEGTIPQGESFEPSSNLGKLQKSEGFGGVLKEITPFSHSIRAWANGNNTEAIANLTEGALGIGILGLSQRANWVGASRSEGVLVEGNLFENKFPLDPINDPKIIPTHVLKDMSGNLNYVVLEDGSLVVGKSAHTSLTGGAPVQAAGEIQLYNGEVKWLDNASGHYQPTGLQIQSAAESAFNNIGLEATGKFQYKVWLSDPSLPRGGKWVKQ